MQPHRRWWGKDVFRVEPVSLALAFLAAWLSLATSAVSAADDWAAAINRIPRDPTQWPSAVASTAAKPSQPRPDPVLTALAPISDRFPLECDWFVQDLAPRSPGDWWRAADRQAEVRALVEKVLGELPASRAAALRAEIDAIGGKDGVESALRVYQQACRARRQQRLATLASQAPRIVFTKFLDQGQGYSPRPAVSDGRGGGFAPGGALCLLECERNDFRVRTLVEAPQGMIRDPDVSFDGRKILFAWRKDARDDLHLYEYEISSRQIRQLTSGAGFADYQGKYLPDGGIVFSSTRCVQTCDCIDIDVSNLYRCNADGGGIRRLGFDQVSTCFPSVLSDGRVLYTRWEYQDRGQIFPQPLFAMNPDGTAQVGYYGNNSWFPTAIHHARAVPGSPKVLAILSGHHTPQMGELALIQPSLGREEAAGVECVAPPRKPPAVRIDVYGQRGDRFQYPCPLGENEYLAGVWPRYLARMGVYYVRRDGGRELLADDRRQPCTQPVPLAARPRPPVVADRVDQTKTTGLMQLRDIHFGPGLAGVPRGRVQRLRIVALEYRPASIGMGQTNGPAGGIWNVRTPVAINGTWDVKKVLGEVAIGSDGSACFEVPARTPIYFQALDERGFMVQSMRSWTVVQPGENVTCVGCHEGKNESPSLTVTRSAPVHFISQKKLPPADSVQGFSFIRQVQPILDRHCVGCHKGQRYAGPQDDARHLAAAEKGQPPVSLLGRMETEPTTGRKWSDGYMGLIRAHRSHEVRVGQTVVLMAWPGQSVNWISPQSVPEALPPYSAGAARSSLIELLEKGHGDVKLSADDIRTIALWIDLGIPYCGDYVEANAWTEAERQWYEYNLKKRLRGTESQPAKAQGALTRMMRSQSTTSSAAVPP